MILLGTRASHASSNSNGFQYTRRENEGNGLYFYRVRYYSPVLGRFVNEDPAGEGQNFYADNDSIQFSDLLGLWSWLSNLCRQESFSAAVEVLKSLSAAGNPKAQYELTNWNRRQHFLWFQCEFPRVTARTYLIYKKNKNSVPKSRSLCRRVLGEELVRDHSN
jgi:RHS repeat-associated protein